MDVDSCLRRRFSLRGLPPWTTASLPLLLASSTSTTCLYDYDLPLRLPSTTCLYGLPLCPASTACLYGLPLRSASTVCLYGLPSSCHRHHHHCPSPVQAEHLSFSFICDLCVFSSLIPEIIFPFPLLSMQLKNVILICC
jgi:hypothetical protein